MTDYSNLLPDERGRSGDHPDYGKLFDTPEDCQAWYEAGNVGCETSIDSINELRESMEIRRGEEVSRQYGFHGAGEGKLNIPFLGVMKLFPGCWPGPAQTTGDCVSHGTKNACLVTLCSDILSGAPDEVTGLVEGVPVVSATGIANGVIATEPIYGHRGHGGQGADCAKLAKYVTTAGGILLRRNYPEADVDLEKYNSSIGARWGGRGTPEAVNAIGKQHPIRKATELKGDDVRDFLANGFGVNTCSGLGFSSTRDENGFSKQQGRWSHSQAIIGNDDRQIIKDKYGEALDLWLNSWAKFNSGGRRILGTDWDIPEGSYWAKSSLRPRCFLIAFSGAAGWGRKVPDYANLF